MVYKEESRALVQYNALASLAKIADLIKISDKILSTPKVRILFAGDSWILKWFKVILDNKFKQYSFSFFHADSDRSSCWTIRGITDRIENNYDLVILMLNNCIDNKHGREELFLLIEWLISKKIKVLGLTTFDEFIEPAIDAGATVYELPIPAQRIIKDFPVIMGWEPTQYHPIGIPLSAPDSVVMKRIRDLIRLRNQGKSQEQSQPKKRLVTIADLEKRFGIKADQLLQ